VKHSFYRKYGKRLLDLALAGSGILILLPVFAFLTIVGFIITKGNPLFLQERAGHEGRPFCIYKFRTIDSVGEVLGSYAGFLRKYSLDELPQLFNVIKGQLSLVGPRPLYVHYIPHYSVYHRQRLSILPGITGLAQVSGRNALSWSKRFDLDVQYTETVSFWFDLKLLMMTLLVWSKPKAADGHKTLSAFEGYD